MTDLYRFRDWTIPDRMMAAIRRYIDHGIRPGHFLTAVISNDLKEAVSRADDENMANLPAFVAFFYNEAPMGCWGSPDRFVKWIARFVDETAEDPA